MKFRTKKKQARIATRKELEIESSYTKRVRHGRAITRFFREHLDYLCDHWECIDWESEDTGDVGITAEDIDELER